MDEPHPVEGIWQPVYAELDGEEAPRMVLEKMEVELAAGKYTVRFAGVASDHGHYTVVEGGLTLSGVTGPNAGRTIPCIYKFVGDMLSVCYGLGGERPPKFITGSGLQRYLVNYQRKS